ncbi:MAG TPA: intradiol ring-cleavage dioxygenase [Chloroflexota bacterium]|nr:intradiol ring-cleavage dioxygenase [Chloroflexota bacterium]
MAITNVAETGRQLLPITPSEIEGPYYKLRSPERSDLAPGVEGRRVKITGRVLRPDGKPIPRAILDFWSSDGEVGDYDMAGFAFRGHVFADQEGRYTVETVIPACYEPRQAKHLHVKVQGVTRPLTTQLYFSGEPGNRQDRFFHEELEIQLTVDSAGVRHGAFDFVLPFLTDQENITPASLAAQA